MIRYALIHKRRFGYNRENICYIEKDLQSEIYMQEQAHVFGNRLQNMVDVIFIDNEYEDSIVNR